MSTSCFRLRACQQSASQLPSFLRFSLHLLAECIWARAGITWQRAAVQARSLRQLGCVALGLAFCRPSMASLVAAPAASHPSAPHLSTQAISQSADPTHTLLGIRCTGAPHGYRSQEASWSSLTLESAMAAESPHLVLQHALTNLSFRLAASIPRTLTRLAWSRGDHAPKPQI